MLDVLEADWEERERLDYEAHLASGDEDGEAPDTWRSNAMILAYMDQTDGRTQGAKAIMKAVFANGNDVSSSAFREVFEKEHRGPKSRESQLESKKRKREQLVDLENDKFGDYLDDEAFSSGVSEPPTPQKPRDGRKRGGEGSREPCNTGFVESIDLRHRIFRFLSAVVFAMRKPSELERLYEEYATAVKLLPLPQYALVVSQRPNKLRLESHVTIVRELFHLLLPQSHKSPAKVDREADAAGSLTSSILEQCYIPYPANTVAMEDNAKLSLLVEASIQLLWQADLLVYTDDFLAAAEKGIDARETKVRKRRTGKMKDGDGELAYDVLSRSAERIRILLGVVKECS